MLVGYADADGSMNEDQHAVSGYAIMINGGVVSWSSKWQEIVVLFTTEAEYVAATHAAKEIKWMQTFIGELFSTLTDTTTLYSDNQSAIALSKDHQYHAHTKHIDIRYHFICWVIEQDVLKLVYCPTDNMVADTLTKPLPSPLHTHSGTTCGLRGSVGIWQAALPVSILIHFILCVHYHFYDLSFLLHCEHFP